jgi:hypothetical protein
MSLFLSILVVAAPEASTISAIEGGRLAEAEQALLAKRERGQWDLDDQITLAAVCLGKGDLACAEFLYNETLQPSPRTALAYFGLAEIARVRGDLKRAQSYYQAYLGSKLPGRSGGYDAIAQSRLEAASGVPSMGMKSSYQVQSRPPTFAELSWTASRYAGLALFPALLAGALTGSLVDDQTNNGMLAVFSAIGVGGAVFGGGVSWGIGRQARIRGYQGSFLKTAAAAVIAPVSLFVGGMMVVSSGDGDEDTIMPLVTVGAIGASTFVPVYVFMQDMVPIP